MRRRVRRHGSPLVATVVAGGARLRGLADAEPAGAERRRAPPASGVAASDRLAVDPARHPPGQLDDLDGAVGVDVEERVVRLDRRVVDRHGRAGARPTTWRPAARAPRAPAAGPALADRATATGGRQRRGRSRRCPAGCPARRRPGQRLVRGDRPAVELQGVAGRETEGVGELAEAVVGRACREDDPPSGGILDLEGGDGRSGHAPMGAPSRPEGEIL